MTRALTKMKLVLSALTVSPQIHQYFILAVVEVAVIKGHVQFRAGKALFIPVLHVEVSDKEIPGATPEYLRKVATIDQDHVTSLYLKINDTEFINEKYDGGIINSKNASAAQYRTPTGIFDVVFPQNAIFGATAGPSKATSDGFYVMTEPLKKGTYNIKYSGSIFCELS